MTPREIEQLLGGYATETLTEEERRILFAEALSNQVLFDALADEQALKELLSDPATRGHLLAALSRPDVRGARRLLEILRKPSVLALAGALAAAAILILAVRPDRLTKQPQPPAEVATRQATSPQLAPQLAPQPAAPPAGATAQVNQPASPRREITLQKSAAASPAEKLRDKETESDTKAESKFEPKPQLEGRLARREPPPRPPMPAAAPPAGYAESHGLARSLGQTQQVIIIDQAAPGQAAKKADSPAGARDLYYAAVLPKDVTNSFMSRSLAGAAKKQKAASSNSAGGAGVVGGVAQAVDRAPGIRYSVLERNPDGSAKEIDPAAPIGIGNRIRIRFEANQEGDLAILRREQDGTWSLWGKFHVRVGEPVYLPADDFVTMAAAGEFHFFVRFAATLPADPSASPLTPTPNLLREQSGNSVYVVNPVRTNPPMDFEFSIAAQ